MALTVRPGNVVSRRFCVALIRVATGGPHKHPCRNACNSAVDRC